MERSRRIALFAGAWLIALITNACADAPPAPAVNPAAPPAAKARQQSAMVAWLEGFAKRLDTLDAYTATVVKRERIDNKVGEHYFIWLTFRRQPKSFYMYFLGPVTIEGRQVLFVENQNDGKLIVYPG